MGGMFVYLNNGLWQFATQITPIFKLQRTDFEYHALCIPILKQTIDLTTIVTLPYNPANTDQWL